MKNKTEQAKMKSGIRKRGHNSYEIFISLGKDSTTGKYSYHWENIKGTKKDAEKRRTELLNQLNYGAFIKPGKATLAEYLERWLKDYAKPKLSPRGYERYESIVRVHLVPVIGNIPLTQLKPEQIQGCYTVMQSKRLSARTVRYSHTVIHRALVIAMKWGLLNRNVADSVVVPKNGDNEIQEWDDKDNHNDIQVWDDFEVRHFLEAVKEGPYFALFHTALFTGMRRNELLGLKWADIDFLNCQLSVSRSIHHLKDGRFVFTPPKSKKSRRAIELGVSTILVLQEHRQKQRAIRQAIGKPLADDDLVFSTLEGKPLRPNTITRAWTTLAIKAGVKPIRLHDARHTHASLLLKAGVHPKVVQERLGHASIQITLDIYSHLIPGIAEAAAAQFDNLVYPQYNGESEAVETDSWQILGKNRLC